MLLGRRRECDELDRLLRGAVAGHGGGTVVHGEPGIGKTALLEYAMSAAGRFQLLRAVGNEAEMDLPFAALHQLCAPGLTSLEDLPRPQGQALRVALGLGTGGAPDRLLVGVAALNLLSQLAAQGPVLCVVDDAQWLDPESARVCGFLARRLAAERIAFVFGAREVIPDVRGLPELRVMGLDNAAALALLRSVLPDKVDEPVLERLVAEAHGNPLALRELPRGLTPAELAGGFALPVSLPLAAGIEASFRRRLLTLPPPSRRLLLVAAAEPTGDPVLVWCAADQLGVDESAAAAVEAEELLDLSPRVVFRHPLVRSAVYGAATPEERRAAHRALAAATDANLDPDRRAWHRSQAASRPDDEVAEELERSATRAQARGGFAAAAAFLARSAELTVDPARRAARALAGADAKHLAGAFDAAVALATMAERGPLDETQRAHLDVLRARVSSGSVKDGSDPFLLIKAAQRLESYDLAQARATYLDAVTVALFATRLANGCSAADVAKAALAAPRPLGAPRPLDLLLDGLALLVAEGPTPATPVMRQAVHAFLGHRVDIEDRVQWSWLAGRAAAFIWDYDSWDALTARQIALASDAGALAVLANTLATRVGVELFAGKASVAASLVERIEAVADATAAGAARYVAVVVDAFRGRTHDSRGLAGSDPRHYASMGEGSDGIRVTRWASAMLYNGLARYNDAFAAAAEAQEAPGELWFSRWSTVELIEAACRTGRATAAIAALDRLAEGTSASGTAWGCAVEDRCRALLSDGAAAETLYRNAVDRLAPTVLQFELARTRLLYGEWLRRERRRVDAREQLRIAHELFTGFGMDGFAERARVELRATGQHARKRLVETTNALTPQEARISLLVAEGATNAEIAGTLFISPGTVDYHLHKVFRKLGVKSRTQLARHVLESSPRAT